MQRNGADRRLMWSHVCTVGIYSFALSRLLKCICTLDRLKHSWQLPKLA